MARTYDHSPFSAQIPTGIVLAEGPVNLMIPHDTLAPEDEIVTPDLLSEVKKTEIDTFNLLEGSFDPEILGSAESCLFNEIPDLALTRQESAQGVRFGQLIVRSFFGDERTELSSLKPYATPRAVAHEFSLARYFLGAGRSHGFRTFTPQGVARLSSGEFALLSVYEHSVRSLDNIFWNPEHKITAPIITRALGKSAYLMGVLHAAGWTHGDAQVKNMFVSNHQEVFIGDLVRMKPFKHKNGRPVESQIANCIDDDLLTLGGSFVARREDGRQLSEEQLDLFNLIYTGIVNSPKSAVPIEIRKSWPQIKELLQ